MSDELLFTPPVNTNACQQNNFALNLGGFVISDALKSMLVSSVACGDETLAQRVNENFWTIACLARVEACSTPDVTMIRLQQGLAEFAMDAARGQIDKIKTIGAGDGESHFMGHDYRDTESFRESQGTQTFRSRASSRNRFDRTSASTETSFSTSRAQSDGEYNNDGTDKSKRQQNAFTESYDKATATGEGEGSGKSFYLSNRRASSSAKTFPNPSLDNITVSTEAQNEQFLYVNATVQAYVPQRGAIPTPPDCSPTAIDPDNPPTQCEALKPSTGATVRTQYRGTGSFSVGIPGVITLGAGWERSWSEAFGYRLQHQCSVSSGATDATSTSSLNYRQEDTQQSEGETHTKASGKDVKDIYRTGKSKRTSTSKLHAESTGRMDSCADSSSSSERKAKGESQNTGASRARSESHSEHKVTFRSISKIITESRRYNQIFRQLAELRNILWNEMERIEGKQRASRGPVHSCGQQRKLTAPPLFWFSYSAKGAWERTNGCKA